MTSHETSAMDWSLSAGLHNFVVKDESSSTFGANIGIWGKDKTESGTTLRTSAEFFFDRDKDKLDPDHLPIWFKATLYVNGNIYKLSPDLKLDWLIFLKSRQNTVSGVEQEIKLLGGTGVVYDNNIFHVAINGYLGFFFLEIDDDVPLTRGFTRMELDRGTSDAYSLSIDTSAVLGKGFVLSAQVQNCSQYGVESDWLENQVTIKLVYDIGKWIEKSHLFIKVEYTEYNLDQYKQPGLPPVLPWNDDTLVQAYIVFH